MTEEIAIRMVFIKNVTYHKLSHINRIQAGMN